MRGGERRTEERGRFLMWPRLCLKFRVNRGFWLEKNLTAAAGRNQRAWPFRFSLAPNRIVLVASHAAVKNVPAIAPLFALSPLTPPYPPGDDAGV